MGPPRRQSRSQVPPTASCPRGSPALVFASCPLYVGIACALRGDGCDGCDRCDRCDGSETFSAARARHFLVELWCPIAVPSLVRVARLCDTVGTARSGAWSAKTSTSAGHSGVVGWASAQG